MFSAVSRLHLDGILNITNVLDYGTSSAMDFLDLLDEKSQGPLSSLKLRC